MRTQPTQWNIRPAALAGAALALVCGAFGQTTPAATAVTGGITGALQTADGKAVAKTPVAIRFRPSGVAVKPPYFNADTTTGADGAFSVAAVPNGTYAVCPLPAAGTLLPPCDWGAEPTVTVANGKVTAMKALVLQAGADLWVHVNDPQGKRASMEGKVPGASLVLMVRAPGLSPLHIPLTSSGPNGFEHHLTVPLATNLTVMAYSAVFGITTGSGITNAVAGGSQPQTTQTAVTIPAGTAQHEETVTIH